MKLNGSATLHGPVDDVWTMLRDPRVLVRTIPGCQRLETVGEDEYRMTVRAGVASIKGTYAGTVRLTDPVPPHSFVLRASGAGNPGTVDASVTVSLTGEDGGVTRLEYDAEAAVGGTIAGVGQRMLAGAARRTAGEFFSNVEAVLVGGLEQAPGEPVRPYAAADGAAGDSGRAARDPAAETAAPVGDRGQQPPVGAGVYEAPAPAGGAARYLAGGDFARGAAFGAAIALAGVVVGGLLGRRSSPRRSA